MFKNYFKTAWRNIWKNRGITFINIIGLCVGMTIAIFMLIWVQNEFSFDNNPATQDVYRVTNHLKEGNQETWVWESSPLPLADAAKKEIPEVEDAAIIQPDQSWVFTINGRPFSEKNGAYVSTAWCKMFHYDFLKGNAENFSKNPFSILLSQSAAQKYFGKQDPLGKTIRINSKNYQVTAIFKDAPVNSSFQYSALIPLSAYLSDPHQRERDENWRNFDYMTFLRLRKNSRPANVASQLSAIFSKNSQSSDDSVSLTAVKNLHFETGLQHPILAQGDYKTVVVFAVLAFLILLVACINYVNLTTARASLRAKEISIRKIAGASRWHLFMQLVLESLIICMVSLMISILLIKILLPYYNQLTDSHFVISLTSFLIWKVLLSTLLFVVVLNSIYPALLLSSFKPLNVFRGRTITLLNDAAFRKLLVIIQFSVSIILIIGSIVILKQLQYIRNNKAGYQRSQIFSLNIPYNYWRKNDIAKAMLLDNWKNELQGNSSIADVTVANQSVINLHSANQGSAKWAGKDSTNNPTVSQMAVDANFRKFFHLQMQQGRWFTKDNSSDEHNFIINETALHEFHLQKPVIGKAFSFQGKDGQIIGVVKDFHYQSYHEKVGPMVLLQNPQWINFIYVKAAAGNVLQALQAARQVWQKFEPDAPFDYTFLDESFNNLYKADLLTSKLILLFFCVAIVISCLGLLGLSTFTARQRIKEIGIRKLLGASMGNIVKLISKDFVALVIIAFVIASPVAWWATQKWLQDFAYRINISWWIFLLAGMIAIAIAIITVSFQAIKASLANPVKSLRTE